MLTVVLPPSSDSRRCVISAKKIAKDSDSGSIFPRGLLISPGPPALESGAMVEKTCAACDCKLDANPIEVKIGGKTVEVCCDECARKLSEAHVSAAAARRD